LGGNGEHDGVKDGLEVVVEGQLMKTDFSYAAWTPRRLSRS